MQHAVVQREEHAVAQSRQNPGLDHLDALFRAGLVPWATDPRRNDAGAVMTRQLVIGAVDHRVVEAGMGDAGLEIVGLTCPSPLCDRASFYWEKWPDSFGTRPHNVQSAASHSSRALSSRHIGLRRNPTEAPVSGVQTCSIHQSGRSCSGGQSIAQHDNLHSAFVG